jgi:hypothetical protein
MKIYPVDGEMALLANAVSILNNLKAAGFVRSFCGVDYG